MQLKTGLRRSIYFLAVALCAKLTFLTTFSFTHPILIKLETVTSGDLFSAHLWASAIAGLLLAAADLVIFTWALRRFPRLHNFIADGYSPRYGTLGYLLSRAEFSAGSGMCIKDKKGIILICNETLLKPCNLHQADVLGRHVNDAFPPRIAAVFNDLESRAVKTRSVATTDIQRFPDQPDGISSIRITATPIFYDHDPSALAGFIIITRDVTEIKLIEQAAFKSRMDYRHLMDHAPLSISICRFFPPAGSDLPDFEVLETSAKGREAAEEIQMREGTSFFAQFPFIAKNAEFVNALRSIRDGGPPSRLLLLWEPIGRTFECFFAGFGEASFTIMSKDVTERLHSEDQVLRINDQLRRTRAEGSSAMETLLSDYNTFMHAVVERVQEPLAFLRNNTHHVSPADQTAYQASTLRIQSAMERMLRYTNASMLPFTPGLLDLNITARLLINNLSRIYPAVIFKVSTLPVLRTSEPVFRSLLGSLLSLLVDGNPGQLIQLYAQTRFMDTLVCLGPVPASCTVLGPQADVDALPEWTELTWELSDDLDLALARRLVAYHGGKLLVCRHESGSAHIGFYLGAPVPYLNHRSEN